MSATEQDVSLPEHLLGLELAWVIIANAYEGGWNKARPEWREAAERWRDEIWHPALDKLTPTERNP